MRAFGYRMAGSVAAASAAMCLLVGTMNACSSVTCTDDLTCPLTGSDGGESSVVDRRTPPDARTESHHDAKGDRHHEDAADSGDESDTGPTCTPGAAPSMNGCITDTSGVFVATTANGGSDSSGTGSMSAPYATISNAYMKIGASTAIYVCGGAYTDQVTVTTAVALYGGLLCSSGKWAYSAKAVPVITGSSASFALKIDGVAALVDVADMEFDGAAAGMGGTSVATWVSSSMATAFHRVKVVGGAGGKGPVGADGSATPNYPLGAAPDGGTATNNVGASGGGVSCNDGKTSSQGGSGGLGGGSASAGNPGAPSYSSPDPSLATGQGGLSTGGVCTSGIAGSYGENGGGAGASIPSAGAWSLSGAAWVPSTAGPGTNGGPGQGGGGGGGGGNGAGGGGGSGGCGGTAGSGGTAGGASFALLSVSSMVTLDHCTIEGEEAGDGGNGGAGEVGQASGNPGAGFGSPLAGCSGGMGGYGQGGGGGAGGSAGLSAALAYVGTMPSYNPADTKVTAAPTAPSPGTGGAGGMGGTVSTSVNGSNGNPGGSTPPKDVLSLPTSP